MARDTGISVMRHGMPNPMPAKDFTEGPPHAIPEPAVPTVLVVEDQALIGLMIEAVLVESGYEVILANDGETALAMASTSGPLLAVVADIHLMGQLDGKAVVRRLREGNRLLPVVVVTGFHGEAPEANLRGLGGPTIRLGKPFAASELIESLAKVLAARGGVPAEARRRRDPMKPVEPAVHWAVTPPHR